MSEQEHQQKSISAGEGSDLREKGRSYTIQNRSGKCLTEEKVILSR